MSKEQKMVEQIIVDNYDGYTLYVENVYEQVKKKRIPFFEGDIEVLINEFKNKNNIVD